MCVILEVFFWFDVPFLGCGEKFCIGKVCSRVSVSCSSI